MDMLRENKKSIVPKKVILKHEIVIIVSCKSTFLNINWFLKYMFTNYVNN